MIAFGRLASTSATGIEDGTISLNTRASRTRLAMSCAYWAPKSTTNTVSNGSALMLSILTRFEPSLPERRTWPGHYANLGRADQLSPRRVGMDVHFCGVRGSTPAPGLPFVRYGGHTSSVAIAHDGERPTLVLDGGTGLRAVTPLLQGMPYDGSILLGHLHWDHVHGLPFFKGGGATGARVDVLLPAPDGDPVETLARGMSPPHFPIGPALLGAGWSFGALREGAFHAEGFSVLAREIPHKGGQTFGFRVSDGQTSLAYMSDHAPLCLGPGPDGQGELHDAVLELAAGVDLLIHDAQ